MERERKKERKKERSYNLNFSFHWGVRVRGTTLVALMNLAGKGPSDPFKGFAEVVVDDVVTAAEADVVREFVGNELLLLLRLLLFKLLLL